MSVATAIRNASKSKASATKTGNGSVVKASKSKPKTAHAVLKDIRNSSLGLKAKSNIVGQPISDHGFEVRVVTLTPSLAEYFLSTMPDNQRKPKHYHLRAIISDIKAGRWKLNGEPVIISKTWKMLNGQHRCLGVVQTGIPIQVFVVWGVDDDAYCSLDNVSKRTGADVARTMGFSNCILSSAIAAFVVRYSEDPSLSVAVRSSTQEIEEFMELNRDAITASATLVKSKCPDGMITRTTLGASHFILSLIDKTAADDFIMKYCTGINLSESCPIRILREKSIRKTIGVVSHKDQFAFLVKAWNAYRTGQEIRMLRWNASVEKFPVIAQ